MDEGKIYNKDEMKFIIKSSEFNRNYDLTIKNNDCKLMSVIFKHEKDKSKTLPTST
jgi:hypothetical protein